MLTPVFWLVIKKRAGREGVHDRESRVVSPLVNYRAS